MARYRYDFPRPMVTADVILFAWIDGDVRVLLIRRKRPPFRGFWAIPGGFVDEDEKLEEAARRELEEETGLRRVSLEQLYTFGDPGRDPRGRTVTVAYYAWVSAEKAEPVRAGDDAGEARWFPIRRLPRRLAFDHGRILRYAAARLRNKLEYTAVAFDLLPRKFTLSELQQLYESVLGRQLDKRNFRRKMLAVLQPLEERRGAGPHRPARLFRLARRRFETLRDRRVLFRV